MAPIQWRYAGSVQAPAGEVFAWLTDYREDDHARPAFFRGANTPPKKQGPSKRTVLSSEGNVVQIRDEWGRSTFESKVTIDPRAMSLRIEGSYGYDATWRVVQEAGGSRVEVHGQVAPGGIAALFMSLGKGGFLRQMEADFHGHMEDLRETMASPGYLSGA